MLISVVLKLFEVVTGLKSYKKTLGVLYKMLIIIALHISIGGFLGRTNLEILV